MKKTAAFLCSTALIMGLVVNAQQATTKIIQANCHEFMGYISKFNHEVIIDVRYKGFYNNQKIHGAILAPSSEQLNKLVDTLDLGTPLLIYCTKGIRSQKVCEELELKGFKLIINLVGGLSGWPEKKYPLDKIKCN